jgi:hypothetical protein
MKYLLAFFLCLTFSCYALPWPEFNYSNPVHDSRIYLMQNSARHLLLFARNENGTMTINGSGGNLRNLEKYVNVRVNMSLFMTVEEQPESFCVAILDSNHELLEKIELVRKNIGHAWSTSFRIKGSDLNKYRYFVFVF